MQTSQCTNQDDRRVLQVLMPPISSQSTAEDKAPHRGSLSVTISCTCAGVLLLRLCISISETSVGTRKNVSSPIESAIVVTFAATGCHPPAVVRLLGLCINRALRVRLAVRFGRLNSVLVEVDKVWTA